MSDFTPYPAYVYIIVSDTGLVKIGISKNPADRFVDIKTASPVNLILYQTIGCPSMETARGLEYLLHKRYKKHQVKNEWFVIDPAIICDDVQFSIDVNALMITGVSPNSISKKQAIEWLRANPQVHHLHPKEMCKTYMMQEHGIDSDSGYKTFERAKQKLGL